MKHHAQETCHQFGDVRRLGYRPTFTNLDCVTRATTPGDGVKCFGFFGSGDKTQSTTNNQVGASEEAQLDYASGSNTSKAGVLGVTGSSLSNVSIMQTDGGAFDFAKGVLEKYTGSLSDLVKRQSEVSTSSADKTTGLLTQLIESAATGGSSTQNKTVLYIGLAIAFVFAVFFFRRR